MKKHIKKNHVQLLKEIYSKALTYKYTSISEEIKCYLSSIAKNAQNQKGVFSVLTTLCIHKIYDPKQDIRIHKSNLGKYGFSGRSIDTKYITPTLKQLKLPAMSESGWLTRSLEQHHPYDLDYPGRIQNEEVKKSFLKIIDYIQKNPQNTSQCVGYLIYLMRTKILKDIKIEVKRIKNPENIDIKQIIFFLEDCIFYDYKASGGSKIPVIAMHSIFSIIIEEVKRYQNTKLKALGSHTASDKTSLTSGDIEIFKFNNLEESIEVKFDRPIDYNLIMNVKDKIYKFNPKRYYIFSTKPIKDKDKVEKVIAEIKNACGCHVIINGIIPTIKYYLRLISDNEKFLYRFITAVKNDSDLKYIHKIKINDLFKRFL